MGRILCYDSYNECVGCGLVFWFQESKGWAKFFVWIHTMNVCV